MSEIRLSRRHGLGLRKARAAVNRVARAIAEDFDVEYAWDGNVLEFERPGVHGYIEVEPDQVRVHVHLSFLLFAIKGRVAEEIERQLELNFGGA